MMTTRKQHFNDMRTAAGLVRAFAGLLVVLSLVGCAPKPVDRVYPEPKMDFGPLQKDASLPVDKMRAFAAPELQWKDTVDSARVFRMADTLMQLGTLTSSKDLQALGLKVGQAFYENHDNVTRNTFVGSLYITAAIGETKEDVMPIVDKYDKMLARQLPIVRKVLKSTSDSFSWPSPETPPKEALAAAKRFASAFLSRAEDSKIDPDILSGIKGAFKTDFYPLLNGLSDEIDSILAETDSIVMIDRLKGVAKKYDFNLGDDTTKMIDQARGVFVEINAIDTSQDALTVIVELWQMTAPESREATFKPVSEQLYNFLKNKGPKSLGCVKSANCLNPIIFLEKQIGLLPAIQKYGLEKLKGDISQAAHDTLVKQINGAVAGFVPTLPQELDDKITAQVVTLQKKLADVRADYGSFIKGIAGNYEKQYLEAENSHVSGLETNRVRVNLSSTAVAVSNAGSSSTTTTGSEVIGDSMVFAAAAWNTGKLGPISYQKSVIQQVNKLLSLGGFQTPSKKPYGSVAVAPQPGPLKHFDVKNDIGADQAFAVPDVFNVASDFTPTFSEQGKNVSIRGQAELLRGLAAMTRYFRDWQKNGFDESIGAVEVGKLIDGLPAGSVQSKLFPKDSFFALSVANAAEILTNMTRTLSPVFLIDIQHKATWANERSDEADQPATMAGLVDIVGGKRTTVVHTADAARFLLAIADFLDATDGIENTQAHPLITPGANGKKPIDQLGEARSQLSMLIVGIANFLSHQMASPDGGVRSTFHLQSVTTDTAEPRRAVDQALMILALVKAGEVLDKQIFEWPALDAYAYMNKSLYDASKGFYVASEGSLDLPSLDDIATILLAGQTLRSHMSSTSQEQWDMLSAPWLKALGALN